MGGVLAPPLAMEAADRALTDGGVVVVVDDDVGDLAVAVEATSSTHSKVAAISRQELRRIGMY
jgi:hypothetical protein